MSSFKLWGVGLLLAPLAACLASSSYDHADLGKSTLTAPTLNIPGDGVTAVPITVTLRRANGKAVVGVQVQVAVDKCMVAQAPQPTSATGEATASVRCAQLGQRTVSATVSYAEFHDALSCTLTLNVLDANVPVGSVPTDSPLNVQVSVPGTDKPYVGTIHFTCTDPDATLPPDYTFTAGDNGVHVLVNAVVLRTPGQQTVKAIDTATGRIVYSQTFTVVAPPPATDPNGLSGNPNVPSDPNGGSGNPNVPGNPNTPSDPNSGAGNPNVPGNPNTPLSCHEVGGSTYVATSTTASASTRLGDIALNASGQPMLIYLNNLSATNVYVQLYDGASWVGLGGSNTGKGITNRTDGVMQSPAMTTLTNGQPAITWLTQAGDGYYASYVFWNGTAWTNLSNTRQVFNTVSNGGAATLAVNSNNVPFVAWDMNGSSLVMRLWGGASWNGLVTAAQTMATSVLPSAGVDANDAPALAWVDQSETGVSKVFVGHYSGSVWASYGGSAGGGGLGTGTSPTLAMDANDLPVVVWDNGSNIYLKAWTGSTWQELGGSATGNGISGNTSGGAHHPTLVMDLNNRPVVAWEDAASGQVFLRHYDGTKWVDDGGGSGQGISASSNSALAPRLRIDPNNRPMIYWQESSATTRLHVCSWY